MYRLAWRLVRHRCGNLSLDAERCGLKKKGVLRMWIRFDTCGRSRKYSLQRGEKDHFPVTVGVSGVRTKDVWVSFVFADSFPPCRYLTNFLLTRTLRRSWLVAMCWNYWHDFDSIVAVGISSSRLMAHFSLVVKLGLCDVWWQWLVMLKYSIAFFVAATIHTQFTHMKNGHEKLIWFAAV